MRKLTKYIPIWVKEPLFVLASETGKLPPAVAWAHARCSYAQLRNLSDASACSIYRQAHNTIQRYLRAKYGELLKDRPYTPGVPVENAPIWVFWWQGLEQAPDLVQRCVDSIRRNSGGHPVQIITKENYAQFVSLPASILDKIGNQITLTHFSDILRVNLLADHGGYWLDATIFVTKPLPEFSFDSPIFTGRNPGKDFRNISNWRWTGYAIAGWKGNSLFVLAKELFNAYWAQEIRLIDYFLIDHVIFIIYDTILGVRNQIDSIPVNNTAQHLLHEQFSQAAAPALLDLFLQGKDTWLYKLTWKTSYPERSDCGQKTIFSRWIAHTDGGV